MPKNRTAEDYRAMNECARDAAALPKRYYDLSAAEHMLLGELTADLAELAAFCRAARLADRHPLWLVRNMVRQYAKLSD